MTAFDPRIVRVCGGVRRWERGREVRASVVVESERLLLGEDCIGFD